MAVTIQSFLGSFPEFSKSDLALINAKLQEAILEVDARVWVRLTDTGVGYLTAHKLALSPFGQNARMVAKDGITTYWTHYQRLAAIVGGSYGGLVP